MGVRWRRSRGADLSCRGRGETLHDASFRWYVENVASRVPRMIANRERHGTWRARVADPAGFEVADQHYPVGGGVPPLDRDRLVHGQRLDDDVAWLQRPPTGGHERRR